MTRRADRAELIPGRRNTAGDNCYLGGSAVPPGGYADPDGQAAYHELAGAAVP